MMMQNGLEAGGVCFDKEFYFSAEEDVVCTEEAEAFVGEDAEGSRSRWIVHQQ